VHLRLLGKLGLYPVKMQAKRTVIFLAQFHHPDYVPRHAIENCDELFWAREGGNSCDAISRDSKQ